MKEIPITMRVARANVINARRQLNERGDCVVRAFSIACCIDYAIMHRLFKVCGRKSRAGTYQHTTAAVATHLGFEVVQVPTNMPFSVARALGALEENPSVVMFVPRHAFAVSYGQIIGDRVRRVRVSRYVVCRPLDPAQVLRIVEALEDDQAPKVKQKSPTNGLAAKVRRLAKKHGLEIEAERGHGIWVYDPFYDKSVRPGVEATDRHDPLEGDHFCADWEEALVAVQTYIEDQEKRVK